MMLIFFLFMMDKTREGGLVIRSSVLDRTSYAYRKACTCAFFKYVDSKTWKSIIKGSSPPTILDETSHVVSFKPKKDWYYAKDEAALGNSCVLNAIYNGVDKNILWLINTRKSAQEALKILEVACEWTSKVHSSRLHLITTNFEAMHMLE